MSTLTIHTPAFGLREYNNLILIYSFFEGVIYRMLPKSVLDSRQYRPISQTTVSRSSSIYSLRAKASDSFNFSALRICPDYSLAEVRHGETSIDDRHSLNWELLHRFLFQLAELNQNRLAFLLDIRQDKAELLCVLIATYSLYTPAQKIRLCAYIGQRLKKYAKDYEGYSAGWAKIDRWRVTKPEQGAL